MSPIRFTERIRYWNEEKGSGLAVCDVPAKHVAALGGLKQQRVRGAIGGVEFASSVMPAGGGRLALTVSKAMMRSAGVGLGDKPRSRSTSWAATDETASPVVAGVLLSPS